jgi:hypothetical protein
MRGELDLTRWVAAPIALYVDDLAAADASWECSWNTDCSDGIEHQRLRRLIMQPKYRPSATSTHRGSKTSAGGEISRMGVPKSVRPWSGNGRTHGDGAAVKRRDDMDKM